ncbi:thioredoxin [Chondromyces apiculatus]|uniref:Thioredoxin n=1 Tax=Chondromyces apiculatus DSM 436 TaxID=1192034 RepID=A0A017SXL3_9BACT|nr:thioredoxin [Chondromyces apiculatus]EYF01698.1 Thioredoxin [Chondromyces apiculatus DSM 436]
MSVPEISEQDFEREVLRSELPVLIDFTATWCGPCKTVAPEVEALARELKDKAKVVKIDIDKSKRIATMLRVQAVPTFMVFHKGRPVAADQGVLRKNQLRALVEPFLPRAEGAIRAPELAQLINEQQVVAVDTREASAFNRAHIPGAVNMPIEEIEGRLAELHMLAGAPVLYCRSGDKTKDLATKMAEGGMPVAFLEGGFLQWEAEMLPIERPD